MSREKHSNVRLYVGAIAAMLLVVLSVVLQMASSGVTSGRILIAALGGTIALVAASLLLRDHRNRR